MDWMLFTAVPGTVVSVSTHVNYRHVGLLSDRRGYDGLPFVISNAPRAGGVIAEPFGTFAGDRPWRMDGFPGLLAPWEVMLRARTCERRTYDALSWNCENFLNHCHGLPAKSRQVATTLVCAVLGIAALGVANA